MPGDMTGGQRLVARRRRHLMCRFCSTVGGIFDDLSTLLESVSLLGCPFVVGCNFNIHVEDPGDSDGVRLAEPFDLFGLTQRVLGPTHQRGGTLDLVVVPQDIPMFQPSLILKGSSPTTA